MGFYCTCVNISVDFAEATKLRGLRFVHQNIRSLRAKLAELKFLISQLSNLHILAFTVTWLSVDVMDSKIERLQPGYRIFGSRIDWMVVVAGLQFTLRTLSR